MEPIDASQDKPQRKYMDVAEFRDGGYLQEANRLFFHPLGLALEIKPGPNNGPLYISGIWDVRDDPEGIVFSEEIIRSEETARKAQNIEAALRQRSGARTKGLGFMIQPLGIPKSHKSRKAKKEKGDV